MGKLSKIKASAMQFAILVSVIIALLLGSFLLFTYTYTSFSSRSSEVISNIRNSDAGIKFLAESMDVPEDSLVVLNNGTPVQLKNSYWGSFRKVYSEASLGKNSFIKIALLGAGSEAKVTSIYLEDNQMPLVVAGDAHVEGNAFIPENIVKAGSVGGNYYTGDQLIYGRRQPSETDLPSLDVKWLAYAKSMLDYIPVRGDDVIELQPLNQSFFKAPIFIFQQEAVHLREKLQGHIILRSEEKVVVEPWAKIDQVLLIAPEVVIKKGFNGSLHVISEKIIVEEGVELQYPSSLVAFEKDDLDEPNYNFDPKIRIGMNSVVRGNILYLASRREKKSKKDLFIAENSLVEGSVYCEGYAEIKGTIIGTIYTKFFGASHNGSLYINHVFAGKVLTAEVNQKMGGLLLEGKQKQVAAWLY